MKVIGEFNKVSDQLKSRKLKEGETVAYQLLKYMPGVETYDTPEDREKPIKIRTTKQRLFPPSVRIPTIDRIWDDWKKDYVDIGWRPTKDKDGFIRTEAFYARGASGVIVLRGGNIREEELYEYFEISNYNESFKYRDNDIEPLFKRIDENAEVDVREKKRDNLLDALTFAKGMDKVQKLEFAAAMNWNETAPMSIVNDQIGEFARTQPDQFIKFFNDPDLKNKALIKNAISKGIIAYDSVNNKMLWAKSNSTLALLERQDGKNYVDLFNEWVKTAKNGTDTLSAIRKQYTEILKAASKQREEEASKKEGKELEVIE